MAGENFNLGYELQKANAGDVDAMVTLASYYFDQKNMEEATMWVDKAAATGDANGMYKAVAMHNIRLQVFMTGGTTFWGPIKEDAVAAQNNAAVLIGASMKGMIELEEDQYSFLLKCLRDGVYSEAVACYLGYEKDYKQVVHLLKNMDGAREQILCGLAYIKLNQPVEANDAFERAEQDVGYEQTSKWPKEDELYQEYIEIRY